MFKIIATLFAGFLLLSDATAYVRNKDCQPLPRYGTGNSIDDQYGTDRIPHPQIKVERVVEVFLEAVEKGGLVLFNTRIDPSIIKPERVEYIYRLKTSMPVVKVYSELTEEISMPAMPGIPIQGVSAILNREGKIIETEVHCGN